ncbi:uncharacterized protein TM35_000024980 [Trypanosoma theileri]|uniref:PDZ domain-containing protein n=1 Tax=Trypanosoma theileri TaxID=67003 RepID=A0A1X0P8C3_9TRYP|nr:uncharacterized protein TM35_000024980 [Trypanosoma theileri]ORC93172.1 hypothetical protein TM35_000024980 [Trypanosoma theileri]
MTEALNRKFDLLVKSGKCPPYLLDVVSLLVAHANDTELFKKELRSAPFDSVVAPMKKQNVVVPSSADQVSAVTVMSGQKDNERVAEINKNGLYTQEQVLQTAEASLRAYATDLKKINDIAMATSSKRLREMKTSTSTEMMEFRDRVVRDTVERTREELNSLRMEWLESMNVEVGRLKTDINKLGIESQKEMCKITDAYTNYISKGFELMKTEPLEVAHSVLAECALSASRVELVEQQLVPKVEIDVLCERVKSMERAITQIMRSSSGLTISNEKNTFLSSSVVNPHNRGGITPDVENTTLLGLLVRDGGDEVEGVIVTQVTPGSAAATVHIGPDCIISHVGKTPTTRKEDFATAVLQAGREVRLTVYDPRTGKVSLVTLEQRQ